MITLLLPHPQSETASAFVLQLKKIYAGAEVLANKSNSGPIKIVVDKKPAIVIVDAVAAGKATASYCNALKNNAKTCSSPILLIGDASSLKYRLEALEYGAEASLQLPAHNAEIKAQVNLLLNLTEKAIVTDAAQIEPERFVTKILSSISDAVFLTNERGDIIYVSENVINLFGYTSGEFKKKKNIYEILGEQIISYKDIKEGREIINIEHSVTNKSGEVLHALINVKAVNFGQGKMLFVCRDITSRKKEQMKVEESESRLKNIIKNAYAGYFFIDKDGFFKKVNQAWLNLHGYENENEILGKHFTCTQTEKDKTVASKIVGDALKGKKATFGEFTRVCKNGEIGYHAFTASPVLENKKVIGLEGFLIDLTEHKKAVDNLHRYKNIVASVPDALAVINKNYQYEYVNEEYEKVSGLKRDQLLGKTIAEFLGNDKFEETIKPQYEKCLRGEEVHFQDWFIPPKGNKHFVDVSYFPYRTPKGEIAGIVASTRNITDKKLLEEKAGENRRQYKLLFEAASDFVFLHEFSAEKGAGKIWDVSNITLERLGYSKDEVLGKRPPDLTTDAGSEITKSSVELARLGKLKFEKVLVSKAGVKIPVEFHARVVEFRNTKMVLSIGRDISERKKAMESLKLSEEKFHKLFKSSPVPQFYWSFNGSDFILKEVNRAALELTLEKASDFIGMPAKEIYSDRSDLLERFHFCMKTRRNIVCETDYIARGTGLTRRVIFTFAYVSDELILLHTEDITKRKQTELELKESEEKFRSLISEMDHGLAVHEAVFDSHGKMTDYRFLDFNESFERQTGLKHAKIVGRTFTEILPGADLFWLEKYEEVVKTGKVAHFEKYEKQTGRYYEVVAYRNRENQFATVVSDITKRRENIKALNNHNKRLEVLTRILKHDSDDLNQLQSFTLEKAIELTESEIGFLFFYNSDTQKFSLTTWSESAKANCGVQNPPEVYDLCDSGCWGEAVRQRKPFIINDYSAPGKFKKGLPEGHVPLNKVLTVPIIVSNDIKAVIGVANKKTDYGSDDIIQMELLSDTLWTVVGRKEQNMHLVQAKEKAEESDRLKSAFLANMSHEIRTPINGIMGFAEMLRQNVSIGEKQEFIDVIKKSGVRMLNTIDELMDISLIEAGQIEVLMSAMNMNELVGELHLFFQPEVNAKGLELKYSMPLSNEEAHIETDKDKISAIMINLIKNAIKYTKAGSIEFGYRLKENSLQFFVKDTGIGIETKRQEAIFERFVQADNSMSRPYEGVGLGLSIAKAYIEMLGSKIELKSEPGVGSEFYFNLPFAFKNTLPHTVETGFETHIKPENNMLNDLTILVAEDDEVGRLYLMKLLEGKCKKLFIANNGKEAVEIYSEHEKIDLVLMDIKMPIMDGYSATIKIKAMDPHAVVIAQTAYALSGDREKAIAAGCNDYLTKPLPKETLINAIEKIFVQK